MSAALHSGRLHEFHFPEANDRVFSVLQSRTPVRILERGLQPLACRLPSPDEIDGDHHRSRYVQHVHAGLDLSEDDDAGRRY